MPDGTMLAHAASYGLKDLRHRQEHLHKGKSFLGISAALGGVVVFSLPAACSRPTMR